MLKVGDKAPVHARGPRGKRGLLEDYSGRKLLIWFYLARTRRGARLRAAPSEMSHQPSRPRASRSSASWMVETEELRDQVRLPLSTAE